MQQQHVSTPIGSMYGIFTYIYHKNQPTVDKYTNPMDPIGHVLSKNSGGVFHMELSNGDVCLLGKVDGESGNVELELLRKKLCWFCYKVLKLLNLLSM